MKTKVIIQIIVVLVIGLSFSLSYGSDDFYYGSFHCLGLGNGETGYLPWQKDSLKFNIGLAGNIDGSKISYFRNASMRAIPENEIDNISPKFWSNVSHYTLWEAEGLSGSYFGFTYHGGGTLINSPGASGGKAMYFCTPPDTAGLIQTGPWYDQEYAKDSVIKYTAEFRLRSPLNFPTAMSSGPPTPICNLMVVSVNTSNDTLVLKSRTLTSSDFPQIGGYKTFKLENYELPTPPPDSNCRKVDFRIYWFGNRALYIDYVKVYDIKGYQLMSGYADAAIKDYVSQSWVDTTIYRWYLKDEPYLIDHYTPYKYVDNILKSNPPHIPGIQSFYWYFGDTLITHEYVVRTEPVQYMMHNYPFRGDDLNLNYQLRIDTLTKSLNECKIVADSMNKDFWVGIQAHATCKRKTGSCPQGQTEYEYPPGSDTIYCCWLRDPTKYEVRLQTFLALCYGADAINNYRFSFERTDGNLETGLYDGTYHSDSSEFQEIAHFTGPRARSLGQQIKPLTWEGACENEEVGSFVLRNSQPSYIDSIVGIRHPDSTYVQAGFFTKSDSMFFMLVNRRTLPSEYDTFEVYFNFSDGPYVIADMYNPSIKSKICGLNRYKIFLQPGEGRGFKLVKFRPYCVFCVPQMFDQICYPPGNTYPTIQSAINAAPDDEYTTVLVDTGTYYQNIDFKGKDITVAGRFHLFPDHQEFIDKTIIDGSHFTSGSDSGSVVRFAAGESSNAVLKGFTLRKGTGTKYATKDRDCKFGGGIYCKDSSPTIINNIIMADTVNCDGGGIYCVNSSPQILFNSVYGNKSSWFGGGIAIKDGAPLISNNIIHNNSAINRGGAIYYQDDPIITNNTIDSNSVSSGTGGGIYVGTPYSGRIENNIIVNSLSGGGIRGYETTTLISYNDVWNNTDGDFCPGYPFGIGDTSLDNNRNGTPSDHYYNIRQNPNFENGYHLNSSSPCKNAGDNSAHGLSNFDYEGNPRIEGGFVDIGAYEYQGGLKGGNTKIASDTNSNKLHLPAETPKEFGLSQSYPNPFNPVAVIEFTIGSDHPSSHITLRIYNITGQLVKTLVDEEKTPGTYTITWDGRNNSNEEVASGVYFYDLKSDKLRESKRMVLIK